MSWELDIVDGRPVRVRELKTPATLLPTTEPVSRTLSDGRVKDCHTGIVDWPTTRNMGSDPEAPAPYTHISSKGAPIR